MLSVRVQRGRMVRILFFMLAAICSSVVAQQSHQFNLGGKEITVSDEMLQQLRDRIDAKDVEIKTHALVKKSDVRWILDYISLSEAVFSPDCEKVKLINTRKFNSESDNDDSGAQIEVGLFDYVWEIKVCDKQHNFRVVNQKGTSSFVVYALEL
jgi:hypothetical protein